MKPKRALTLQLRKYLLMLSVIFLNHFYTQAQAPANDVCANAILLTSGDACVNTTQNIRNATYTAGSGATCGGTPTYDIWFKFVAKSLTPTITISNWNNTYFQTPRVQVFSGSCGSLTNIGCNTTAYTTTNLTTGDTFYIRVYSTAGTAPTTLARGQFDICIDDAARPTNDLCSGAVSLTQSTSTNCGGTTNGNLTNATASSAFAQECGNANSPDVWYSFVATTQYPEVFLDNAGAQLTSSKIRLQLFSGTCLGLIPINCSGANTNLNALSIGASTGPLTVGVTYFIRVYSNASVQSANSWNFRICVRNSTNPTVHNGKTYVNITKGVNGGTIEPNDELEIRTVLNVKSNSMYKASYADVIPANTTYIPGTLRILTNEGIIFRQWTDAPDTDPATILGSNITINLGNNATSLTGGSIRSTDRPSLFGGECILIASYRVRVNPAVAYGTLLQVGGGSITYRLANNTNAVITFANIPATVYPNYGICTNTVGSNGILSEFGGTFGSGNTKDRAASSKVPANYAYSAFGIYAPGDYFYGISNNTSADAGANYSINPNDVASKRVFNVWDILGDHTGAADPLLGNPPTHVNGGQSGGYMVVINAAYRADTAFQDTVRNLCPNTSYEYSAWFRNVCRTCGGDSTGVNYSALPIPYPDSSGVHPNLTFNINGSDYYTTGDILYTGRWIKKGFTYRTGPSETQMIINIRNNAPGGGGNDWAIDDIGVATCSPALVMNPATPTVNVCYGDGQSLSAQVVSFYDNYTQYIWERSNDNGFTWNTTAFAGTGTPVSNGTEYEYTAVGPSLIGDSSTHRAQFRLRVASSPTNLADVNCSFRAIRTIQVMVSNCMYVLKTKLVNVSGTLVHSYGNVSWTSTNEEAGVQFIVEKSTDGTHFKQLATVHGKAGEGFGSNYHFEDPNALKSPAYYRIVTKEANGSSNSKLILLSPVSVQFEIKNVLNPFDSKLSFDVVTPVDGSVRITILDNYGRVIKSINQAVNGGVTPVKLSDHGAVGSGVYALKVEFAGMSIIKRIVKVNN